LPVERRGIRFPAIPELDIEGVDAGDIAAEEIIPVFQDALKPRN